MSDLVEISILVSVRLMIRGSLVVKAPGSGPGERGCNSRPRTLTRKVC